MSEENFILNFSNSFFVLVAIFFCSLLLLKKTRKPSFLFILISFVSFGVYRQKSVTTLFEEEVNHERKESVFIAEILEVNNKKEWKKATVKIKQRVRGEIGLSNKKSVIYINTPNSTIYPGDLLLIKSTIRKINNKNNPGEFNSILFWKSKGINAICFVSSDDFLWIKKKNRGRISSLIERIKKSCEYQLSKYIKKKYLGVSTAILLGDKSNLNTETKRSFGNTGAMHLLAVSGLHVGIIYTLFVFIFSFFSRFISKKKSLFIILLLLWFYALITGFSPSVSRAVFMFTVLGIAKSTSNSYSPTNSLFFSGFILLLINPLYIYDIGFQLSYLAMLGIFIFYKPFVAIFYFNSLFLDWIWKGTIIGVSAQLMTLPLTLYYFHSFPNYFLITNLGIMCVSSVLLILLIALTGVKWFSLFSKAIGLAASFILFILLKYILWIEGLPGSVATGYFLSFSVSLFLICCFLFLVKSKKKHSLLIIILYIGTLSYTSYTRYQNITIKEICVFNHSSFVLSVKLEGKIYCFYEGEKKELEKAKHLINGYARIHPGKIFYKNINGKKYTLKDKENHVYILKDKKNICIEVNNKNYKVLNTPEMKNKNITYIYMPWINDGDVHLLKDGAFRTKLN